MGKSRSKKGALGVKIDLAKVFDMIEWDFITTILRNMGLHQKFIGWIYQCIGTTTLSMLINGSPKGYFHPTRGLR